MWGAILLEAFVREFMSPIVEDSLDFCILFFYYSCDVLLFVAFDLKSSSSLYPWFIFNELFFSNQKRKQQVYEAFNRTVFMIGKVPDMQFVLKSSFVFNCIVHPVSVKFDLWTAFTYSYDGYFTKILTDEQCSWSLVHSVLMMKIMRVMIIAYLDSFQKCVLSIWIVLSRR